MSFMNFPRKQKKLLFQKLLPTLRRWWNGEIRPRFRDAYGSLTPHILDDDEDDELNNVWPPRSDEEQQQQQLLDMEQEELEQRLRNLRSHEQPQQVQQQPQPVQQQPTAPFAPVTQVQQEAPQPAEVSADAVSSRTVSTSDVCFHSDDAFANHEYDTNRWLRCISLRLMTSLFLFHGYILSPTGP